MTAPTKYRRLPRSPRPPGSARGSAPAQSPSLPTVDTAKIAQDIRACLLAAAESTAEIEIAAAVRKAVSRRRTEIEAARRRSADAACRKNLEKEHGLGRHPKRDLLWNKAWELGHSDGYDAVRSYYADLAELLT